MPPRSPNGLKKASVFSQISGFTLIELLVVVSIILILAGLTVPVLTSMQKRSLLIKCANNLRHIHSAFSSYLADNNNIIFWRGNDLSIDGMDWYVYGGQETGNRNTGQQGLFNRFIPRPLNPYVAGDLKVFFCPCDTQKWAGGHSSFESVGTSYNFNANGRVEEGIVPGLSGASLGAITKPSATVLFFDASLQYMPGSWHGAKENICFLDGHLEALSYTEFQRRRSQTAD